MGARPVGVPKGARVRGARLAEGMPKRQGCKGTFGKPPNPQTLGASRKSRLPVFLHLSASGSPHQSWDRQHTIWDGKPALGKLSTVVEIPGAHASKKTMRRMSRSLRRAATTRVLIDLAKSSVARPRNGCTSETKEQTTSGVLNM